MKANEVMKLLRISRPTLCKYVKDNVISVNTLPNGRYDYNTESVYAVLNKGQLRKTCIYARVSTAKQKTDLRNQIELLNQFCAARGFQIANVYSDVASGISFESRNKFFEMLDLIMDNQIEKVVITYKDRLSRVGFFKHLFAKFNCEIVAMNDTGSEKLDSEEIFEEIVSLLHCYSMKLYSKYRVQRIKEVLENEQDGKEADDG